MIKAVMMGCLFILSWFEIILFYDLIYNLLSEKICLKKKNVVIIICNIFYTVYCQG